MLKSTKKSFSKRAITGKAYRFWSEHGWRSRSKFLCDESTDDRWSSRWSQVALEKVRWSSESKKKKIERSWSDRENLLRSLSRQQQMPETSTKVFVLVSTYPHFSGSRKHFAQARDHRACQASNESAAKSASKKSGLLWKKIQPKVKSLTKNFNRKRFFDRTHFLHMERQSFERN